MGASPPSAISAPSALSGFDCVFSSLRLCVSAVIPRFRLVTAPARRVHLCPSVAKYAVTLAHPYCPGFAIVYAAILYFDLLQNPSRIHVFDLASLTTFGIGFA